MNVRRRSGDMSHPIGSAIKNAVTQRKDSPTTPMRIANAVSTPKDACYANVKGAITNRKG